MSPATTRAPPSRRASADADAFESPESLAADIEVYIAAYLDISPAFLKVASTYVLFSWVYDVFNEVPYLRFRGEFGSGKTRALTVIGSLLNKGSSPVAQVRSPRSSTSWMPSARRAHPRRSGFRFSDEKAELSKILNNGNVKGFPVLRQTVNAKRSSIRRRSLCMGRSHRSATVVRRHRAREPIPHGRHGRAVGAGEYPEEFAGGQNAEARALRNQLLMYRFRFRNHVGIDASLESENQSMRTNQIIVPLLSVAPTSAHREAISLVAGDLDANVRTERAASLDAGACRGGCRPS